MSSSNPSIDRTVDTVLDTLPPVWDRIRKNLRAAGTCKLGITLEQFHVLRHIRKGYDSASGIADARQVSRPAISQAVDILVSKGLVTRKQVEGDRRCVRLELTAFASEVLDANYDENRAWMRQKMASLTADERGCVLKAMKVLRATFAPGES